MFLLQYAYLKNIKCFNAPLAYKHITWDKVDKRLASRKEAIRKMKSEHLDFNTFCVGSMADALHWSAARVYGAFRSSGLLTGYIIPCYDVLHTFSKEYLVEDLTQALREKGVLS